MQSTRSSRPASGAEHQFSHLWDMQHHAHLGTAPSHGFKVGIGTLASLALYELLLALDAERLDVDRAVERWPTLQEAEMRIREILGSEELAHKAIEETRAKHPTPQKIREQLLRLRASWPEVRRRLAEHLSGFRQSRTMLRQAGCPADPRDIGISLDHLQQSYEQAYYIRRRYTVLDFFMRFGLFEDAMSQLFAPDGFWGGEQAK